MEISHKTEEYANYLLGAGAGFAAFRYIPRYLVKKPMNKLFDYVVKRIPEEENVLMFERAKDAFMKTNLPEKNISVVDVQPENAAKIIKEMNEKIDNKEGFRFLDNWFKKQNRKAVMEISKGKNAGYVESEEKVFVNKNKLGFSAFHEIGHAITWKSGGLKSVNAGMGNILGLVGLPLMLAVTLLKNKKKEGEETKGFFDKTTTFIKNNCALLTGLIFVPALIDEALASINGARLAKNVLDGKMYKKVNKLNGFAYSSYVMSAILSAGFIKLACVLRDKIAEKKPIKLS